MCSPLSLLSKITCESVLASRPTHRVPIVISANTPLSEACRILADASITSAPVFSPADHSFIGFLDYMDIIQLIVRREDHSSLDPWLDSLLRDKDVTQATAGEIAALFPGHSFCSIRHDSMLDEVCKILVSTSGKGRIRHRLPVTDSNGKFIGVISQSDLIKILYGLRGQLNGLMSKSVHDLGLGMQGHDAVVTCDVETSLIHCLQTMVAKEVSSVGLVDEDYHIIMVFSLSDTKYLMMQPTMQDLNNTLNRSVGDYKSDLLRSSINVKDASPVYVVHPNATVEHTMGKIVATHAHRIYVCQDHVAKGVISTTDLLNTVIELNK